MKIVGLILLAMLAVAEAVACDKIEMGNLRLAEDKGNFVEFEKELRKLLPAGSPEERVISVFEKLGWESGYDKGHNLHFASKKVKGSFFVKSRATIYIYMNAGSRVERVNVSVASTSIFG